MGAYHSSTRVFFLVEIHFSAWHHHRFGIDRLKARGFEVVVLDCTRWLFPKYYRHYEVNLHQIPELYEIDGPKALAQTLGELSLPGVVFDLLGFSLNTQLIRQSVFAHPETLRATWNLGVLPTPSEGRVRSLLRQFNSRTSFPQRAINYGRRYWTERWFKPVDLVLLSGRLSACGQLAQVQHKIGAHSFDYDRSLELTNMPQIEAEPYLVYLDEDIIDHPDLEHGAYKPPTSAERFYPQINSFFEVLEQRLGMPVVIAAHPKGNHDHYPEWFGGRRIEVGCTAELVRESRLVLGHASCSFNYPMIWRKPVIILTSDDLNRSYLGPYIEARAAITGDKPYNIDHDCEPLDLERFLAPPRSAYDNYMQDYVKQEGSPDKLVWEIFADYVEQKL